MLKKIMFYILGLFFTVFCFGITFVLTHFLYNPINPSGGDNFILFIIAFIVLAIAIPTVSAFFFWKKNKPFSLGIATAPITVPVLLLGISILSSKLIFWGNINPDDVISKLEDYKKYHGSYPSTLEQIGIKTMRPGATQEIKYVFKDSNFIFCSEVVFFDAPPGQCYNSENRKWEYWDRLSKDDKK